MTIKMKRVKTPKTSTGEGTRKKSKDLIDFASDEFSVESFRRTVELGEDDHKKMRTILGTPEHLRTLYDYQFMDRYGSAIKFFAELSITQRFDYYKCSKLVELQEGKTVFQIGEKADGFFAVIMGTLDVIIDISKAKNITMHQLKDIINQARKQSCFINPGQNKILPFSSTYVVKRLMQFDTFGELGLLTNGLRTATVQVATPLAILMKIDKEDFLCFNASRQEKAINEKIDFLKTLNLLKHRDKNGLFNIAARMEIETYSLNKPIIIEGESSGDFYMIKSGECKLVKRFYNVLNDSKFDFIELAILTKGQYFIPTENLSNIEKNVFSAIPNGSSCTVYRIEKMDFINFIAKDNISSSFMKTEFQAIISKVKNKHLIRKDILNNEAWNTEKTKIILEHTKLNSYSHIKNDLMINSSHSIIEDNYKNKIKSIHPKLSIQDSIHQINKNKDKDKTIDKNKNVDAILSPRYSLENKNKNKNLDWLKWAKQATEGIVIESNECKNEENQVASNVRFSRIAKIMMEGDDNITAWSIEKNFKQASVDYKENHK